VSKDKRLYTEMGMLHILDRNRRIKERPEKFQDSTTTFDVILTCEEKVYDQVATSFEERQSTREQPVHLLNLDVVDTPEDATIGAFLLCELCQMMAASEDLDDEMEEVVQDFEAKFKKVYESGRKCRDRHFKQQNT
jgi:RNA polymerase II subunit A C-terminal domain phosphatase SSU72